MAKHEASMMRWLLGIGAAGALSIIGSLVLGIIRVLAT